MEMIEELQEIRDRLDVVIAKLRPLPGEPASEANEPQVPEGLVKLVRKDAIERVLEANYDLHMPGRAIGAMRNKEIAEVLNKGGRSGDFPYVDMYLGSMKKEGRIEWLEWGLYRAKRR